MTRLNQIQTGCSAIFISASGGCGIKRKITDLGLIPGEKIKVIQNSGHGQVTVSIKGSKLAIGHGFATKIAVREESS